MSVSSCFPFLCVDFRGSEAPLTLLSVRVAPHWLSSVLLRYPVTSSSKGSSGKDSAKVLEARRFISVGVCIGESEDTRETLNRLPPVAKEIAEYSAEYSKSKACVHFFGKSLRGLDYACRRTSRCIACCRGFDWKCQ